MGSEGESKHPAWFSLEEVHSHNSRDDLWMVIDGKVYDCTRFADVHPGGKEVLYDCAGLDATGPFKDVCHSEDAVAMLKPLFLGYIHKKDETPLKEETEQKEVIKVSDDNNHALSVLLLVIAAVMAAIAFLYLQTLKAD